MTSHHSRRAPTAEKTLVVDRNSANWRKKAHSWTLGSGDFKDRIGWIRELSAESLRSHRRDGLMLGLTYQTSAATDMHDLVGREQVCGGFLLFDVRESADAVYLRLTAPPDAESAADELFAHFVA
jgi:hypothetical protein